MTFSNLTKPNQNFSNTPKTYNFLATEDGQIMTTESGEEIIIEEINSNWINQIKPL